MGVGTFKSWGTHLAKATWLFNTRGSTNLTGPAQSEPQQGPHSAHVEYVREDSLGWSCLRQR